MATKGALAGRTAVVTGASSGIGRAIAEVLGAAGAHVVLGGRTPGRHGRVGGQDHRRRRHAPRRMCTTSATSTKLRGLVAHATESTGRLDIMVNNAGLSHPESILEESDPEHWRVMLETNVFALLVGSQAAVQAMRACGAEGHIVNISSVAALRSDSGVYGATKHAVNCITNALRRELLEEPIKVITVMPGAIATNFARNFDPAVLQGLVFGGRRRDTGSRDHQGRTAARRGAGRCPGGPARASVHPRGRGRGGPVGRHPTGRTSTCRRSWSGRSGTSTCSPFPPGLEAPSGHERSSTGAPHSH